MENEPEVLDPTAEETSPEPEIDVAALQAEKARIHDRLLRTAADFDNFRKRSKRDIEDAARRAREDTIRELLPIIDNLERAVDAADGAADAQAVAEGVRMVLHSFSEVAQRMSLQRINAVGERFDPNRHDAVQQLPSEEHEAGSIMAEIVPGYTIDDRLLRAALVVVSLGKGS